MPLNAGIRQLKLSYAKVQVICIDVHEEVERKSLSVVSFVRGALRVVAGLYAT